MPGVSRPDTSLGARRTDVVRDPILPGWFSQTSSGRVCLGPCVVRCLAPRPLNLQRLTLLLLLGLPGLAGAVRLGPIQSGWHPFVRPAPYLFVYLALSRLLVPGAGHRWAEQNVVRAVSSGWARSHSSPTDTFLVPPWSAVMASLVLGPGRPRHSLVPFSSSHAHWSLLRPSPIIYARCPPFVYSQTPS